MDSLKKYIRLGMISAFCMGAMASCSEDNLLNSDPSNQEGEAGYITFQCSDMLETFVGSNNPAGTRAGGPKNPEEKTIKTLHVFFFDPDGNLLEVEDYDNFNSYQRIDGKSFIKIPTGEGVREELTNQLKNVHIVAIANIDATDDAASATDDANKFRTKYSTGGMIRKAGRNAEEDQKGPDDMKGNGNPYEISNYEQLTKWVYYPRIRMNEDGTGDITSLPEAGMPMIGEKRNVNLSTKPSETIVVNLIAMMAKVNVSVELDPDQYTDQYPLLRITGYGVRNMPIAIPYKQPDGTGPATGKPTHEQYLTSEEYNVTKVPMFHKGEQPDDYTHMACDDEAHEYLTHANVTINKDSEPATFSYYTFENINLPDYSAIGPNGEYFDENHNVKYPTGVSKENYERWKSKFAYSDRASALILKGEYTTHQGLKYNAQFTVFLGSTYDSNGKALDEKERSTNFEVKRNHRYDNNIVIHGLDYIRNSDEDVYNFDGRVNVYDENPFYLAMVNERKVDAHATALPMDVWFMLREDGQGNENKDVDWKSQITFTIKDHDGKEGNWLRMEKIPRATMEKGRIIKGSTPTPFAFGTGARDYFTTDLVTNTLKDNDAEGTHGWQVTVDADKDGSRSRIYFYIDENVPANNNVNTTDKKASDYYGERKATIEVNYVRTNADGTTNTINRSFEIEQRALLKISGEWKSSSTSAKKETVDFDAKNLVTWMEVYEEYLEHSDPLDQHESKGELYTGLKWGLRGEPIGFSNPESGNGKDEVYYKEGAFEMTRWVLEQSNDLYKVKLFNIEEPPSAFHYCFGKNKRNADGSADYIYEEVFGKTPLMGWTYSKGFNKVGWYMPGIRELEKALVDYYGNFPEFQGFLYWSASCLTDGNNNYARATRVNVTGSGYTYANSKNSGDPGYQDRKEPLRIRAFYRVDYVE